MNVKWGEKRNWIMRKESWALSPNKDGNTIIQEKEENPQRGKWRQVGGGNA